MRKYIIGIILPAVIVLSGCFGGDTEVAQSTELPNQAFDLYKTPDYQINYPKGWKVKRDFVSNIAKSTEVAFISHVKEVFFTPTVTIGVQTLSDGVTHGDFAQKIIDQNAKTVLNYNVVDRKELAVGEDGRTFLIQFQGKRDPAENIIEYFQLYFVKGTRGFVVTGAHDPNGDTVLAERLLETVMSFQLR